MGSLDALLYAIVRAPEFAHHTARGGGVQASDLVRRVGRPLAAAALEPVGLADVDPRAPLAPAESAMATDVVAELRDMLLDAARLARATVEAMVARTRAEGIAARPAQVGERVLTRVAARLLDDADVPEQQWRDGVCAELIEIMREPEHLTPGEFASRYSSTWNQEWGVHGVESLASHPPSSIGVGPDRRPPLVRPECRSTCSWLAGTDRSVYDRYALHWRGRNSEPDPHAGRPGHVSPTCRAQHRDIAGEEVVRAARPYGLAATAHQAQLREIYTGASAGSDMGSGRWRTFSSGCRPADAVDGLAMAVSDCLAYAMRGPVVATLAARIGDLATHSDFVAIAVVRKVWIDLHRREREFVEPTCACMLSRYIRVAVDKGVPEALNSWIGFGGVDPCDDSPGLAGSPPASAVARADRENATFALLLEHRDVAEGAFRWRTGWMDAYRALVGSRPPGPERYLTASELSAYITGRADPDRTDEEER